MVSTKSAIGLLTNQAHATIACTHSCCCGVVCTIFCCFFFFIWVILLLCVFFFLRIRCDAREHVFMYGCGFYVVLWVLYVARVCLCVCGQCEVLGLGVQFYFFTLQVRQVLPTIDVQEVSVLFFCVPQTQSYKKSEHKIKHKRKNDT